MSNASWFALQVARRHEFQVASQLRMKGYEEFVPVTREPREWSDRTKSVPVPVFPGYVFCHADPKLPFPILTTPGVVRFVGYGKRPTPIADDEIDSIKVAVASGAMIWRYTGLATGERVELTRGPLTGCHGVIKQVDLKQWIVVVSITLLHRSVAVEIDPSWVTLVKNTRCT